jgi:hypothetical protein
MGIPGADVVRGSFDLYDIGLEPDVTDTSVAEIDIDEKLLLLPVF